MGLGIHDPVLSCKHQWRKLPRLKGQPQAHVCGYDAGNINHTDVVEDIGCGALAVFDERNKIVEYDRTFNWGRRPTVDIERDIREDRLPEKRR